MAPFLDGVKHSCRSFRHFRSGPQAAADFAAAPDAADLTGTAPLAPVLAAGAAMPTARMTQVSHLACPEASARGCTVMPSSTTGRNGSPGTASGGTGWCAYANSTVTDFSRSFSADGSANVPRNNGCPVTSSNRGLAPLTKFARRRSQTPRSDTLVSPRPVERGITRRHRSRDNYPDKPSGYIEERTSARWERPRSPRREPLTRAVRVPARCAAREAATRRPRKQGVRRPGARCQCGCSTTGAGRVRR